MGQFHDPLVYILIQVIQRERAGRGSKGDPIRDGIDCNHPFDTQKEGGANGHLADGSAAPDSDRIAGLDIAEIRCHVTGRENIRKEQDLLVRQPVGDLEGPDIGVWNPHIFGLSTAETAEQVGIAEQACRGIAPHFLDLVRIGVAALAA